MKTALLMLSHGAAFLLGVLLALGASCHCVTLRLS